MDFLVNLNLNKNEIQNAVVHPLALPPTNPKEGQIYYNSADKLIYRYDGANWGPVGVVYNQGSSTGVVITGLDTTGKVTTTNVTKLTLDGLSPIPGGYVSAGMSLEAAIRALDEAVKNAVAGGGEVNQNAFSNVNTAKQSTAVTDVTGNTNPVNIAADAKTDTINFASGNKWVQIKGDSASKTVTIGHKTSGVVAGQYGTDKKAPKITVDESGHITNVTEQDITFDEYSITKSNTPTSGALATYQLTKNGQVVGVPIDIPKDYLVKDAKLKTSTGVEDPSGFPAGTEYIDFIINTKEGTGTESHIYLNVETLAVVYTAGNGIEISQDNKISAKVVIGNGLNIDASGIKMGVVSGSDNGAMLSSDKNKLDRIEDNATANSITLNGENNASPNFYAPTDSGTPGQILVSNGGNQPPSWKPQVESIHKYTGQNTGLTSSGGAFTWSIPATTHKITNAAMMISLYEIATGDMVIADISVNEANFDITIVINDAAESGTLAPNTYRVVAIG